MINYMSSYTYLSTKAVERELDIEWQNMTFRVDKLKELEKKHEALNVEVNTKKNYKHITKALI